MAFPFLTPESFREFQSQYFQKSSQKPILSLYVNTEHTHSASSIAHIRKALQNAYRQNRNRFPDTSRYCEKYLSDVLTPHITHMVFDEALSSPTIRGIALFAPLATHADVSLKRSDTLNLKQEQGCDITGFSIPTPHAHVSSGLIQIQTCAEVSTVPFLQPLLLLLDQEEPVIILACWADETRIYEIFLGRCKLLGTYSDTLNDIIRAVSQEQQRSGAQRIVLAGDIQATRGVRTSLPERLRALIIGIRSLPEDISESEVATCVAPLLRAAEHREEQERIHLLAQKSSCPEDAVVGLRRTLHMITKQQVGMIVLQQGYEAKGSMCNNCDALLTPSRTCPYCRSLVYPVDDIVTRAVERASRDGAIIEFVPATTDIASLGYVGSIARSSFPV